MKLPLAIFLSLSLTSQVATSAQIFQLQGEKRIECTISKNQLNRIQCEGDRITAVYGGHDNYVIETDEVAGQIFLKSTTGQVVEPIYLSLVTEGDITQDLKLTPINADAQTILLKPGISHSLQSTQGLVSPQGDPHSKTLIDIIKRLSLEKKKGEIIKQSPITTSKDLKVVCFNQIWADKLEGCSYEIMNQSSATLKLTPDFFTKPNTQAIAFERAELGPNERTYLYIVSKGSGR